MIPYYIRFVKVANGNYNLSVYKEALKQVSLQGQDRQILEGADNSIRALLVGPHTKNHDIQLIKLALLESLVIRSADGTIKKPAIDTILVYTDGRVVDPSGRIKRIVDASADVAAFMNSANIPEITEATRQFAEENSDSEVFFYSNNEHATNVVGIGEIGAPKNIRYKVSDTLRVVIDDIESFALNNFFRRPAI